jgi:hypothetical protein
MNNSDGTLSLLDKAKNYLDLQGQNSEWIDEPELVVAAESILAASLMIVSHPSGPDESLGGFAYTSHLNPKGEKTMHLLRTNKQHYDVLIPATHSEEQLKSDIHGRALEAAMSLAKVHPKKIKLHTGDEYWIFGMPANGNCGYFATNFLKKVYSPMFQRDGEHFAVKWSRKFEALSDADVQVARQVGDSFAQFKEVSNLSDGNQLGAYDETTAHGTQMLLHIFKVLVEDETSLTVIGDLGSGLGNCLYYLSTLSTLQGKTICCVGIEEDQQLHHNSKAISLRLGSQQSVSMMMCPYENVSSFNGLDAVMLYEGHAGSSFTMTERHFKMILTILRSKTVQIFSSTKLQSNLESIFRARSSEFETALTDWQVIRLETNIGRRNNRPQTYLYVRKQAIFAPDARWPWGRDTVEADSDMRITNLVTAARLRGLGLLWTVDVEVNNTKAKKVRSKDLVDGSKIGMISGKIKFQCCFTSLVVVPGCAVTARGNITGVFVGVCYHHSGMHEKSNESAFRNPADLILQVQPSDFRVISQMDLVSVDNISPLQTVLPADVKAGWEMYLLCKETSKTMCEQDIEARRCSRRLAEVQNGLKRARDAEETEEAKERKKSEEAEKAALKSAAAAEKESIRIDREREAERGRERRRDEKAESQRARRAKAKRVKTSALEPSDEFGEDAPETGAPGSNSEFEDSFRKFTQTHNPENVKRHKGDTDGTGTPGSKSWSSSEFEDSFRKFIQTHNPENVKRDKGDTDGTGTPGNNSWSRSSADGTGTPRNNSWSSSSADGTESYVNESVMKKIVGVVTDALLPLQSRLQELKPLHGKLEELLHEKDITLKAKHDADVKRWVQELQAQSNDKMEQLLVQETSRIRAQIEAKDATTKEARKAAERLKEKKDATAERLKEEDATRDKFESMRLKMDHTLDKALGNFDVMRAMHDLTNQVKATQLQGSQRSEDWSRN